MKKVLYLVITLCFVLSLSVFARKPVLNNSTKTRKELATNIFLLPTKKINNFNEKKEIVIKIVKNFRDLNLHDISFNLINDLNERYPNDKKVKLLYEEVKKSIDEQNKFLANGMENLRTGAKKEQNYLKLANIYMNSGNYIKSIKLLNQMRLEGINTPVSDTMLKFLRKEFYEKNVKARSLAKKSMNELKLKHYTSSMNLLKQALNIFPNTPEIYEVLASYFASEGNYVSSYYALMILKHYKVNDRFLPFDIANIYFLTGDYEKALTIYTDLEKKRSDHIILTRMAMCFDKLGDKEAATDFFNKAKASKYFDKSWKKNIFYIRNVKIDYSKFNK